MLLEEAPLKHLGKTFDMVRKGNEWPRRGDNHVISFQSLKRGSFKIFGFLSTRSNDEVCSQR